MSKGGGGGTQTSTSTNEPWKASQPYLTDAMRRSQNLVGRPASGMPSTVAPFSPETEAALQGYTNRALAPDPLAGQAQGAVSGILGSFNPGAGYVDQVATGQTPLGSTQGRGIFEQVAQGQGVNPYTNQITAAGATPTTAGTGILGQFANGGANPYLDRAFDAASRKVSDAVSSRFVGQGGGSGYQQRLLQEGLGDLATNIYGGAYESDQNRRLQAAGLLPQIEQADRAARLGSLQSAAGLSQQDLANRLSAGSFLEGAAGSDISTRLGAADLAGNLQGRDATAKSIGLGLLPAMRDYQNAGLRDLATVGAARENLTTDQLADQMMRYQQPWSDLMNYSGIISGFGGLGGTQTSTAPKQRSNPFMGGLSGASGALGIASMIPGLNAFALPMAIGGGLLGAFG